MNALVPSFPCPKCGGRVEVKDSRPSSYHGQPTIRRRRRCQKCGFRCTTYEIIEGSFDRNRITSIIAHARRIKETVDELIVEYDTRNEPAEAERANGATA